VATPRFDRARIAALLDSAGRELRGAWLLIGGAAAASWFSPSRTTEDLDLIGLGGTQGERFAVMQLAEGAGLPVEAVNSAADFFVRKIADWRDHLVELHRGPSALIYRPDATLFLLLKIGRLSETDLEDCLALLEHLRSVPEPMDAARLRSAIDTLPETSDAALAVRRARLRERLP
jgi:hypothetical protein